MAKWTVSETKRGSLHLSYRNRITGEVFCCGELRNDTPRDMTMDWIVHQGQAATGDVFRWHDGVAFVILPESEGVC